MNEKELMDFKFTEHQLGVVDSKANNILMVDSVLIVISTLSILFEPGQINPFVKGISTAATICVLASVALCIRTIWTKWATELPNQEKLEELRDTKTKFLNWSLRILATALGLFVLMFIVDFIF
jgi:hypothetical protein